jgi:hypothetical protein
MKDREMQMQRSGGVDVDEEEGRVAAPARSNRASAMNTSDEDGTFKEEHRKKRRRVAS